MPTDHFAYELFDADGILLYVGITSDPDRRWEQHAADKPWWPEVVGRNLHGPMPRHEAAALEREWADHREPTHQRPDPGPGPDPSGDLPRPTSPMVAQYGRSRWRLHPDGFHFDRHGQRKDGTWRKDKEVMLELPVRRLGDGRAVVSASPVDPPIETVLANGGTPPEPDEIWAKDYQPSEVGGRRSAVEYFGTRPLTSG